MALYFRHLVSSKHNDIRAGRTREVPNVVGLREAAALFTLCHKYAVICENIFPVSICFLMWWHIWFTVIAWFKLLPSEACVNSDTAVGFYQLFFIFYLWWLNKTITAGRTVGTLHNTVLTSVVNHMFRPARGHCCMRSAMSQVQTSGGFSARRSEVTECTAQLRSSKILLIQRR